MVAIPKALQPDFLLEHGSGATLLPAFSFERGAEGCGLLITGHQSSPSLLKTARGPALKCQTQVANWPYSLLKSFYALALSYSCILNPSLPSHPAPSKSFQSTPQNSANSAHESPDSSQIHQSQAKETKGRPAGNEACRRTSCPAALSGLLPAGSPNSLHFNVEEAREPLPLPTRAPGYNGKAEREEGCLLA